MNKVYVRDFETRSIIKEIDVSNVAGTSNYDRFVMGLMRNMDLDRYFLDDDDYLKEQEINKREREDNYENQDDKITL